MSHSTTGTSSYILSKYSRSYPTKRTFQKAQMQSQNGPELMSDWQHFTNPLIRLVLDVKTTTNGEIESVKLRILWQLNSDLDAASNQADMVFEDLDLLSFSAIMPGVPRKNQTEGLPLKAVYRDTVVGIRYLHSREDGVTPVYRRFQISFQAPSEASDFIELIKPICPCKINPTHIPPPAPSQSQMPGTQTRPTIRTHAINLVTTNSFLPDRGLPFACPPPSVPAVSGQKRKPQPAHTPTPEIFSTLSLALPSSPSRYQAPLDPLTSLSLDTSSSGGQIPEPFKHTQKSVPGGVQSRGILPQNCVIADTHAPQMTVSAVTANVPSSSLPSLSSSDNSVQGLYHPSIPGNTSAPDTQWETVHPLLSSLIEATSIYNLPNSTLEQYIGEIVHEDGFVQLLERVSEMLTVRTILDAT